MHIDNEIKLDFQDVLIRPKRSTLESRSQVSLERTFRTAHGAEFSGVPIVAANMSTGTFEMLDVFSKNKMFVAIAKYLNPKWNMSLDEWNKFATKDELPGHVISRFLSYGFYTIGMSEKELEELKAFSMLDWIGVEISKIKICIDIANGYTQRFASFVEKVRKEFPKNVIVAGNVATQEMVQELIIAGADYVKIGIGPGCFVSGTKVQTTDGLKNIEDIEIGNEVFTHTGSIKKVIDTLQYTEEEKIISVNGIKSTSHHEYYVIEKQYKDIVNDNNIHEYAKWIPADQLDKNIHLLIRRK